MRAHSWASDSEKDREDEGSTPRADPGRTRGNSGSLIPFRRRGADEPAAKREETRVRKQAGAADSAWKWDSVPATPGPQDRKRQTEGAKLLSRAGEGAVSRLCRAHGASGGASGLAHQNSAAQSGNFTKARAAPSRYSPGTSAAGVPDASPSTAPRRGGAHTTQRRRDRDFVGHSDPVRKREHWPAAQDDWPSEMSSIHVVVGAVPSAFACSSTAPVDGVRSRPTAARRALIRSSRQRVPARPLSREVLDGSAARVA